MLRSLVVALIAVSAGPALAQTRAEATGAPLPLVAPMPPAIGPQLAQQPLNLLPPREQVAPADKPLLEEEPSPSFQPLRPAEPEPAAQPPAVPTAQPAPEHSEPQPTTVPPVREPERLSPAAVEPAPMVAGPEAVPLQPTALSPWVYALMVLVGAVLAGLFGIFTATLVRRGERKAQRRAIAVTLATELETRRLAFESLPLPPNAEAGVSFVSSVTSLAGIDAGFRAVQANLHLLPEKLAAHVCVHYAAVQRVSDFVKGQSLAAAVRMLQANRLGGHPCPDAGTMRDAHVELGAAFRGLDKLAQALRKLR